jgi:hypothetical protein
VIYIQKENRTYDQILGDLAQGNGDPKRVQFPQPITPNEHLLATRFALLDNYYDAGDVSGDGWNWDMQGHANDVTTKNVLVGYGNANYNIPFDWNGNPRNIGIALPDTTTGTPSPSTVRITTLFDPTGGSSIEPGSKDITADEGADDLEPDALGGYIWDSVMRAGLTVRHYGLYADENYYVDPVAGAPFYIPIDRNAFADKVVQAVPVRKSLLDKTDVYYRGWDLNTPDQYRFDEWNREFNEYVKKGDLPNFEMVDFMEDHFGNFSTQCRPGKSTLADGQQRLRRGPPGRSRQQLTLLERYGDLRRRRRRAERPGSCGCASLDGVRAFSLHFERRGIHTMYNSTNVLRTIEDILGVDHLGSQRRERSPDVRRVRQTTQSAAYTAPIPGILCQPPVDPTLVPECNNPGKRPITAFVKSLTRRQMVGASHQRASTSITLTWSIPINSIGSCGGASWETTNLIPRLAFN